ncbi:coat protein [Erysiphe necator associated tymo-like virus 1]|nr:coat protein [Erysiphe necator associated tymo-like virus 1]
MSFLRVAEDVLSLLSPVNVRGADSVAQESDPQAPITTNSPSSDIATRSVPDHLPIPTSLPALPSTCTRNGIAIPFQCLFKNLNGTYPNSYHIHTATIKSLDAIKNIIKPYREALLLHLEVVIYPTSLSISKPLTNIFVWTPDDITPEEDKILDYPGATAVTSGGIHTATTSCIPCPFGYCNPLIKTYLTYTNTPRLTIKLQHFTSKKSEDDPAVAYAIVRGQILCSTPIPNAW